MKFLLELVACCTCGCVTISCSSSRSRQSAEETRLLVAREPTRRRVRRRRVGGRARGGSNEWRPSLSSISEDYALMNSYSDADRTAAGRRRDLKRTSSSVSQYVDSDYYDRRAPILMPSFTPTTAFMF